jgi:diguanylate cyclase (GGDEF)-like protein
MAAAEIAERLRAALERTSKVSPDGTPFSVTASFGVSVSRPDDDDLRRMVDAADQAMYRAKREGRNRVRVSPAASNGVYTAEAGI